MFDFRIRTPHADLAGAGVFITGGSRGLGLELAREFTRRGARVAIAARDRAELDRVTEPYAKIVCDVGDRASVEAAIAQATAELGAVNVLVNNAGVIEVGPFEEQTEADFAEALNTHLWGPLYATWAVLPQMRARRSGRIVNISSIGGKVAVPHLTPYCASKFALTGLSHSLRAELRRFGVIVTTVIPGLMRTGSPDNAFFKGRNRAEYAWFTISDSLPGLSISVEAAARAIVDATESGEAEITLGLPAKIGGVLQALLPEVTDRLTTLANLILPRPGGIGTARERGRASHSAVAPSVLTASTQRAGEKHNEMPAPN